MSESGHSRRSQAGPLSHLCPQHPNSDRKFRAHLFVAMLPKAAVRRIFAAIITCVSVISGERTLV